MKKFYFFLIALVVMTAHSWAYDFSYTYQGQTLYYNIVDGNAQVISQNSSAPYYTTYPTGALTIPTSVTYNGNSYLVTSIHHDAFRDCSGLTSITIPNSVTSIATAFKNCSGLTSVYYTGDVAGWCRIEFNNYYSNPLYYAHNLYINNTLVTDLVIPNSVTEIKHDAFYNASCLTSLTIPSSVTSIGASAFYGCDGLTSVIIPNSVTSIGGSAFYGCSGLTSITIPNYVFSIGCDAFSGCTGLTEIHSLNLAPPTAGINNNGTFYSAFEGVSTNIPVYIPCGRLSYYTSAQDWSRFTNLIESSATSFSAVSNNNTMGTVQVITMPTCSNPQAVVYAVANSGYEFDRWSDNSTSNPYTLTVNEDMELTAYFSPVVTYYTITVTSDDDEMGIVSGGGTFAAGTQTTISATANAGYHFVQWQDGNTSSTRTITVTGTATYTAYFAADGSNEYVISVVPYNPDMGSTTGSGTYEYGTVTTITAEPFGGYSFVQWQDGNTQRIRTITVTGNATYTAYFERNYGIDDIEGSDISVSSLNGHIVINGMTDAPIYVYDIMGRMVAKTATLGSETAIDVPQMGVYMVKIGNAPAWKVVVR